MRLELKPIPSNPQQKDSCQLLCYILAIRQPWRCISNSNRYKIEQRKGSYLESWKETYSTDLKMKYKTERGDICPLMFSTHPVKLWRQIESIQLKGGHLFVDIFYPSCKLAPSLPVVCVADVTTQTDTDTNDIRIFYS